MLLLAALLACGTTPTPGPVAETPAAAPAADEVLTGTVQHRMAAMNDETWMAGGGDYYVLDVGTAPVKDKTSDVGVILKPSTTVTADDLGKLDGQTVEVHGVYVAPTTPTKAPEGAFPMGANGGPAPSGGGFAVSTITAK
jgi:hypothetical protein